MHYIIDGYNLTFNIPNKSGVLEDNRREVLNGLKTVFSGSECDLTIVFDGKGVIALVAV